MSTGELRENRGSSLLMREGLIKAHYIKERAAEGTEEKEQRFGGKERNLRFETGGSTRNGNEVQKHENALASCMPVPLKEEKAAGRIAAAGRQQGKIPKAIPFPAAAP